MRYIFLVLLAACSAIHLYDSWQASERRNKSKPFLVLLILLFYITSVKEPQLFLLLALITCWLGDVLLIPEGHGWFTAGGISFLCGHIFFILSYAVTIRWEGQPVWLLVIAAIVYFGISLLIMRAVKPTTPKAMVIPMLLYLIANSLMNVAALMQLITWKNFWALTAYLGAFLFFLSDCLLFLVRYHKNKDLIFKKHFIVMLAYVLGVFLITLGMMNLL